MVQSFCSGSVQWAFGTIRSHPDRPGKMLTLRDSSARSAADVSTTWLATRTRAGSHADTPPIMRIRRLLCGYAAYYNVSRTHRSLNKDAPLQRAVERLGAVVSRPVLGGLHPQYCRI